MSRKCYASILEPFPKNNQNMLFLLSKLLYLKEENQFFKWYIEVHNYDLSIHCKLSGL